LFFFYLLLNNCRPDKLLKPATEDKVYYHFHLYVLRDDKWNVGNMMKLSIMCDRCFGSGDYFYKLFKDNVKQGKAWFNIGWCRVLSCVLIPEGSTCKMKSAKLTSLTDIHGVNFYLDAFDAAEKTIPLVDKSGQGDKPTSGDKSAKTIPGEKTTNADLETCFHSVSNEMCPVVNALFAPMGIWHREASDEKETLTRLASIDLCPYVVPDVNHRTQNIKLVQSIMHQTILDVGAQKDLSASSTVLPFRMVSHHVQPGEKKFKGFLHGYNSMERSKLIGGPSVKLLYNRGDICVDKKGKCSFQDLDFLLSVLLDERNPMKVDGQLVPSMANGIRKNIAAVVHRVEFKTPSTDPFDILLLYSSIKSLLSMRLRVTCKGEPAVPHAPEKFLNLIGQMLEQVPSLRDFFPYDSQVESFEQNTRYPFHHLRFLIGSMTLFRDAALEGCHRNYSQILALMNLSVPGAGAANSPKDVVINSSLFFKPTTVYNILPALAFGQDPNIPANMPTVSLDIK
jgi:hypothetical protein